MTEIRHAGQKGFSLLELLFVVAIVALVASIAVMGFASAGDAVNLGNGEQQLSGHLEKARLDAIKRHAEPGFESSVSVIDETTYRLAMDFDGDGDLEATEVRDFNLPQGVTFQTSPLPAAEFDANGHLESDVDFTGQNRKGTFTIRLSKLGGISKGSATPVLPTVSGTPYPTPTPTPTPAPAATPAAPAGNGGCVFTLVPTKNPFVILKNGRETGIVNVYLSVYRLPSETVTLHSYDSNALRITPSSVLVTPDGYAQFEIIDVKNAHHGYDSVIEFNSPCGAQKVTVRVSNS